MHTPFRGCTWLSTVPGMGRVVRSPKGKLVRKTTVTLKLSPASAFRKSCSAEVASRNVSTMKTPRKAG
eukprot:10557719-Heterocapsa_arctica.AAC.1